MDETDYLKEVMDRQPGAIIAYSLEGSSAWKLADGHFTKPIDFGELLASIAALTGARPRP